MKRFLSQYWFPTALIALLLLFIPGLVLFALNLFGFEKRVNEFLEQRVNLTYHLPLPWWGILLLLLLPVLIVLLYFLKLKRKPLAVPSTFLWKKSIEDLHVNSLFQWLRENVLLLLQVLAVLLLIYAVMAFHLHGQAGSGRHYILMIDNSASMSATDLDPNRLEWAKQEALKVIDAATDADFGMVIAFNSSARPLQSYTSDRGLLRQAVRGIEPTQRATRIEEALNLADSLANPVRSTENAAVAPGDAKPGTEKTYVAPEGIHTEVHLFSDGRFPDLAEGALARMNAERGKDSPLGNLDLRYHVVGKVYSEAGSENDPRTHLKPAEESRDNVGIITFNARRDEEEEARRREQRDAGKRLEEIEPGKLYLLVTLQNFTETTAYVALEVSRVEGGKQEPLIDQSEADAGSPRKTVEIPGRELAKEKEPSYVPQNQKDISFKIDDINNRAGAVLHARMTQFEDAAALAAYKKDGTRTKVRKDRFPLDDEAWLVVGVARKSKVLIVGEDNDVLSAFFKDPATQDVAEVTWIGPGELPAESYKKAARNGEFDLVIFDRCSPADEKDMPRSNTFFIGSPPPPWRLPPADGKTDPKFKFYVERLTTPRIKGWESKSSVLRYLTGLYELGILEGFSIKDLPQRDRLIETDKNGTLLFTQGRGPFTDLVLGFALLDENNKWNSDWPLQPSFPLFMRNILYALGNLSDQASEERVQPGREKILRPEKTVRKGTVTAPDGTETVLSHDARDLRTDFSFNGTTTVGVYDVRWEDGTRRSFAVNLLDREESNIEPRPGFELGSVHIEAGGEIGTPREVWKYFALLALLVLLLEWYIYNRRVYV
ncbi:hypothetical protein AYO40_01450 [Planctomycetaceae bacterium SCGC AG-212-D15]|nr:hypothetical protein AYO40_01450 [Planctomycetaceae bacterium SCGC AG-212-D15]